MFSVAFPVLNALNVMRLATPQSAILSAVIFNALIIIALILWRSKASNIARLARPRCCDGTC